MSVTPDYEHDAHVYRTRDGWQRWHAYCQCGWRWAGTGGRFDAERAAREHDGNTLQHTCYEPSTMEYDPGPCAACLAEAVDPPAGDLMSTAAQIGEYLTEQLPPDETKDERTARIHKRDAADSYRRRWHR